MADFNAQDQIFQYFQSTSTAFYTPPEYDSQDHIFDYFQSTSTAFYTPPEFDSQDQIFSYFQSPNSGIYNTLAYSAQDTLSQLFVTPPPPSPGITTYYAMRAKDPDCPTLTYVTWVVTGSPDATGAQYTGPRCGASPLTDVTITAKWQE